jgi:hypothetical protein
MQIPLVVLTDTSLSDDEYAKLSQENFFGINVTYVERALTHLLDPEQVRPEEGGGGDEAWKEGRGLCGGAGSKTGGHHLLAAT